jgi:prolyl-tRNA synthetase|tara:strand:- start:1154 stop:2389 length:1236 start_codon:yes stop_codon:yes gene_type:complete
MKLSNLNLITLKNKPSDAEIVSHQLMLRSGMIKKLASGLYTWMPLGYKVLKKIEIIIAKEMDKIGCLRITMPAVQPKELWEESSRWDKYGKELLRINDRHEREFCFGPTHEEVVTDIIRRDIKSYKQLPITLYQIQTKFRDEIRPRFGVMRAREFLMKDAYSFHSTNECLNDFYKIMYESYKNILNYIGLEYKVVSASSGQIGGDESHEFHVIADSGEDELVFSKNSDFAVNAEILKEEKNEEFIYKRGIEVGHIFKLGSKYSDALKAKITNQDNNNISIIMGCYGIGVSRMVAASIEQCNDERGIIWPKAIAPYDVAIVPVGYNKNEKIKSFADSIYKKLIENNIQPLLDDRDISAGAIFSDNDLIGTPIQIIIGKKFLDGNEVEIKDRSTNEYIPVSSQSCMETVLKML